jgi:hypothetical protein
LRRNINVRHVVVQNWIINAAVDDVGQCHRSGEQSVVVHAMLPNIEKGVFERVKATVICPGSIQRHGGLPRRSVAVIRKIERKLGTRRNGNLRCGPWSKNVHRMTWRGGMEPIHPGGEWGVKLSSCPFQFSEYSNLRLSNFWDSIV